MTFAYDPIPVLQSVGYTEREAAFLYLVALHSGYFLRRQYLRFIQRGRGALAEQLLRKATAFGHLQSIACGEARIVYHLAARQVYDAIGHAGSQHRRLKGDARIKSRLMVLDFVLDHLGETMLDTSESKVSYFLQSYGLKESLLPHAHGGAFIEEFPLLIKEEAATFTFFDEGALSASFFESFLRRYHTIFTALPGFELLYLSASDQNFERAGRVFARHYPEYKTLGVTAMTPHGVDHFLEYLRARESADSQTQPISLHDLAILRESEAVYTTLEHEALVSAWQVGSTSAERIRQRFQQRGPLARFTATLMPYQYPLYSFRHQRRSVSGTGSSERSSQRLPIEQEVIKKQLLRKGGK